MYSDPKKGKNFDSLAPPPGNRREADEGGLG